MKPKYFLTFEQIEKIVLKFYDYGFENGVGITIKDCVWESTRNDLLNRLEYLLDKIK